MRPVIILEGDRATAGRAEEERRLPPRRKETRPGKDTTTRVAAWAGVAMVLVSAIALYINILNENKKRCLDPRLFDRLVSGDSKQVAVARYLLCRCGYAEADLDAIVRQSRPGGRQDTPAAFPARRASGGVAAELHAKGLMASVADAKASAVAGSPAQIEQALTIYLGILDGLSPQARSALHPAAIEEFHRSMKAGATDRAIRMLVTAFEPYIDTNFK
jgi:hypothetical protein